MKHILLIFFCYLLVLQGIGQNTDINLLRDINVHRNVNLDDPFIWVTQSDAPICITAPLIIYGVGWYSKNEKLKMEGLVIAASLVVTTAIATGLKYSINRTRPFDKYSDIQQVIPVTSPSFPSGHTSIAFSTATSLSLVFPKWYVIAPSYVWASTVAYSRMHLGEHYPSDVLAGMVIGTGSAYLCYRLQKMLMQKNEKKVKDVLIQE
jgi:membrane-associated phospholipid phosphatase